MQMGSANEEKREFDDGKRRKEAESGGEKERETEIGW